MTPTNTQTIDDTTCLALWVTWLMNIDTPDHPLPDDILIRGSKELKRQWDERGYKPDNAVSAGILYASMVWATMAEHDKVSWIGRLIQACKRDN